MDIENTITKMCEAIGIRWSVASDLGRSIRKVAESNPDARVDASVHTGTENGEPYTEFTLRVKLKGATLKT